jgi:hypothetical protein
MGLVESATWIDHPRSRYLGLTSALEEAASRSMVPP